MKSIWYQSAKDPLAFEKRVRGCQEVLDKLREICYNKQIELNKARLKDYDTPNYSLKRAHQDGFVDGLEYIISLLTLDQREE